MKHQMQCLVLVLAASWPAVAHASVCQEVEFAKRPAIAFVPFPLENPQTGEKYLPHEEIEVRPGKKMLAREFFNKLNDTEQKLNKIGYSLRDEDISMLGKIDECLELLDAQSKVIDAAVDSELSDWNLHDQLENVNETWKRFTASLPDWDTLRAKADSEEVKVYLPPVPAYTPPVPGFTRLEAPELKKERSWSTEFGQKSKFWGSLSASYSIEATESKAKAQAQGAFRTAVLGKWEGEIVGVNAKASAFQDDAASLSIGVDLVGRSVYSKSWKQEGLKKEDKLEYTVDKGVNTRFSIGPIPVRVRVGFAGGVGLRYGYQVVPIQIGAYSMPFVSTRAYAQAGVDIGIAGAGVGGELILIEDELTLKGVAGVTFAKELKLVLELSGTNVLRALAGRLYVYAYIDLWIKRWEGRFNIWKWRGLEHKGEIFRYRTEWTPRGMIAQGDVQPEDLVEISEQNAVIDEAQAVHELEVATIARATAVFNSLRAQLESETTQRIFAQAAQLEAIDGLLDQALDSYWDEVRDWTEEQQGS